MTMKNHLEPWGRAALVALAALAFPLAASGAEPIPVKPAQMPQVGTVDERFQSYNVEMVEVTGGRFWAPYRAPGSAAPEPAPAAQPSVPGIDPTLFRLRPPIDLSSPRLRTLAAALGPAYVRVSGTWANSTYFHDSDEAAPTIPPAGFGGVLTRQQWRGLIDFSRAVNARIVTSFAISAGTRDPGGVWTPAEAGKLLAFTKAAGGQIAAAEFFNEPSFAAMGGAPKGYDAAAYARDFAYHFYGSVSRRCAIMPGAPQTTPEAALTEEWLSRTDRDAAFYAALRDRFEPGKPLWLTETGEAACGGNPWASTFIDSFRYLDQLGRLARRGVQVVAHNTLAASDYALIEEATLTPRPDYWAALLWSRLMGRAVLDAGPSPSPSVHLYAHCLRSQPGGVALLAINVDREAAQELAVPMPSERYTLSSPDRLRSRADLNGRELKLGAGDALPEIAGEPARAGAVRLAPASITFLAFPKAGNASCR
jgi:hypothetical protein